ncbi:inner membrane localized protein, partial [Tanacetum coccineum]
GLNKLSFAQSRVGNVTSKRTLSIQARYSNDGGSSSGSAFIGGFVLGGVLVGTLGAIFAPQKTRQKLAQKIAELNSAIDDVSSQLKSDDDEPANGVVPDETEALA